MSMPPPFDSVAGGYDHTFTRTRTGRLQRDRVQAFVANWLKNYPALRVLELNCGTGEDALWLASLGCEVLATDVSPGMIGVAREKAKASGSGAAGRVRYEVLDMNNVSQLAGEGPFDLIFSNFGGFNCLSPEALGEFAGKAAPLLVPGGHMIAVVMGRKCGWETLYFSAKGQWKTAMRRRTRGPVMARLTDEVQVATWYFSPNEFAGACVPHFAPVKQVPIGLALPPSYLDPFFRKKNTWLTLLAGLEARLGGVAAFADFADHYLLVLRRV